MNLRQLVSAETSDLADRLAAALAAEVDAATRRAQEAGDAALQIVRGEAEELRAAVTTSRTNEKTLHAAVQKLRADRSSLQAAVDKYRADERGRQETIASLQASEKSLRATVATLQASETALQATIERLQAAEKVHQRELEQAADQTRAIREQVLTIASAPLEHLSGAFQRLASAGSVEEVLTMLIEALGCEFSRVALFHVNGNRLEGRRQTGFDFGSDISKVIVPLTKGSALAEAVQSGRAQGLTAAELPDGSHKLFGGSPSFVLALPVMIAGEIQAVIYADNSDQPQPQLATTKRSVRFSEILLCHAVPLLERLSAEEMVMAELRAYCAQLLTDLESVYNGEAAAGHKGEKLQRRLQHNVEYARSMYAQRQSGESVGAGLFDTELAATIAGRKTTPFGADLAIAAGAAGGDSRKQAS